jgi:hypothetical protein
MLKKIVMLTILNLKKESNTFIMKLNKIILINDFIGLNFMQIYPKN